MNAMTAAYVGSMPFENEAYSSSSRSSVFPIHRVVVDECHNYWTRSLLKRLDELASLPIGWDGYAGRPVSYTLASFVATILNKLYIDGVPVPGLVPGGDGTLQIEWHVNQIDIEIDVLGTNNVVASFYDHESGAEDERLIKSDFTAVFNWLRELASRSSTAGC